MDGNSEQLQVINLKQLPIIEERLRDVKAKIEQRTSAVMALAVTEETRTDVKKIRTEVRKELEGYEAQRMAVKKAIMTPYEQFEAVYKECVSNPYKAADEALGKKIADVEVGIKQQKEDDVRAFFNELTSGFGLDWLKFEQMNLKVTLTCTPKAMKAAITQSVTKIVRDCAALEENPDRDEIMVEYQKSLDLSPLEVSVSKPSFSKATVTPRLFSSRTDDSASAVLRAKRDADLTSTRSISPARQSSIRRLNCSRRFVLVPVIPSSV